MNTDKARRVAIEILDEFEEMLDRKGIMIPSEDREGVEGDACLYGSEYYSLEDAVKDILVDETRPRRRR